LILIGYIIILVVFQGNGAETINFEWFVAIFCSSCL